MEVKGRHVYKQSAETVFKSFGDRNVITNRFIAMGGRNIQIQTCKLTKTSLDLLVSREVPADVPTLLKKVLGEWNLAKIGRASCRERV